MNKLFKVPYFIVVINH